MVSPEHSPEEGHLVEGMVVVGQLHISIGLILQGGNTAKNDEHSNICASIFLLSKNSIHKGVSWDWDEMTFCVLQKTLCS